MPRQPTTQFEWRSGYNNPVPAQTAGEHISRLGKGRLNEVTVSQILADAKSPRSPLHQAFTWDNVKAGAKWREHEARTMLNHLVVITHEVPERPRRVLVNVRNPSQEGRERRYVHWNAALGDPPIRQEILLRATKEILFWREKYKEFDEFSAIFQAIDSVAPALREELESVEAEERG